MITRSQVFVNCALFVRDSMFMSSDVFMNSVNSGEAFVEKN